MYKAAEKSVFSGLFYFMNDNFTQTFHATGLQAQHAYTLARNSFEASFIDASTKRRYINGLDKYFETFEN